jgi:hypothetical protein
MQLGRLAFLSAAVCSIVSVHSLHNPCFGGSGNQPSGPAHVRAMDGNHVVAENSRLSRLGRCLGLRGTDQKANKPADLQSRYRHEPQSSLWKEKTAKFSDKHGTQALRGGSEPINDNSSLQSTLALSSGIYGAEKIGPREVFRSLGAVLAGFLSSAGSMWTLYQVLPWFFELIWGRRARRIQYNLAPTIAFCGMLVGCVSSASPKFLF